MKRHKIRVIYKSGAVVDFTCDSFEATRQGGTLASVKWENIDPRPLHFGVDEVAAILEMK